MKHPVRLCTTAALFLVLQCATTIPITVRKPAQLDIPPLKKIAVLDMVCTGDWHFWHDHTTLTSFEDIARRALIERLKLDKRERPHPTKAFDGVEITNRLITALIQNGHYQVVERNEMDRIMAEHALNMSGLIDESQAAQLGAMLGVEALLIGSAIYTVTDKGEWFEQQEKVKKEVPGDSGTTRTVEETVIRKRFRANRLVNMDFSFRIVDISSGRIVAANTLRTSNRLQSVRDSEQDAYQNLPEWRPAISSAADNIVRQTVLQISPHNVRENRALKPGKSPSMKRALEYAKRGMFDDAENLWNQVASQPEAEPKDKLAASNNLAVCAEVRGDLEQAEKLYNSCYQMSGKGEYLDKRALIQRRMAEAARLREQDAN